jgi:hypothetical protein
MLVKQNTDNVPVRQNTHYGGKMATHYFSDEKIELHPIDIEGHSIKLITERINDDLYKIVLINSGYGIQHGNDKIFFAIFTNAKIFKFIMKSLERAETIHELYDIMKIFSKSQPYDKHDGTIRSDVKKLEALEGQCEEQISGSCSFFSSMYAFYYMIYYGYQPNLNIDRYKSTLEYNAFQCAENIVKYKNVQMIEYEKDATKSAILFDYDIKDVIFFKLLKLIDIKFDVSTFSENEYIIKLHNSYYYRRAIPTLDRSVISHVNFDNHDFGNLQLYASQWNSSDVDKYVHYNTNKNEHHKHNLMQFIIFLSVSSTQNKHLNLILFEKIIDRFDLDIDINYLDVLLSWFITVHPIYWSLCSLLYFRILNKYYDKIYVQLYDRYVPLNEISNPQNIPGPFNLTYSNVENYIEMSKLLNKFSGIFMRNHYVCIKIDAAEELTTVLTSVVTTEELTTVPTTEEPTILTAEKPITLATKKHVYLPSLEKLSFVLHSFMPRHNIFYLNFMTTLYLLENKNDIETITTSYNPSRLYINGINITSIHDHKNKGTFEDFCAKNGINVKYKDDHNDNVSIIFKNGSIHICHEIKHVWDIPRHGYKEFKFIDPFDDTNISHEMLHEIKNHNERLLVPYKHRDDDFIREMFSEYTSPEDNFYYYAKTKFIDNIKTIILADIKSISDEQLVLIYMYYLFYDIINISEVNSNDIFIRNKMFIMTNINFKLNPVFKYLDTFNLNNSDIQNARNYLAYSDDTKLNFIDSLIVKVMSTQMHDIYGTINLNDINISYDGTQIVYTYKYNNVTYYSNQSYILLIDEKINNSYYKFNTSINLDGNVHYFSNIGPPLETFLDINENGDTVNIICMIGDKLSIMDYNFIHKNYKLYNIPGFDYNDHAIVPIRNHDDIHVIHHMNWLRYSTNKAYYVYVLETHTYFLDDYQFNQSYEPNIGITDSNA